jgi:hypothetical protein
MDDAKPCLLRLEPERIAEHALARLLGGPRGAPSV